MIPRSDSHDKETIPQELIIIKVYTTIIRMNQYKYKEADSLPDKKQKFPKIFAI